MIEISQAFAEVFREVVYRLSLALLLGLTAVAVVAWLAKTIATPMRRLLGGSVVRLSPIGWLFPWRDGFADGLTIFSYGEIRPNLRTPYFPRPFEAPLAVVPAFNWPQLPGGVSNVFWHAATPSNSLIVAWGAGMELELVVFPTNVSFMGIAVQEVPTDYKDPQGYFANSYFDVVWSHTTNRGAGAWHMIQAENLFMYDYAEMGDQLPRMTPEGEITDSLLYGWIVGSMNWMIPVGWNEATSGETELPARLICVYWQRFRMASDGTLEVEKLGNVVQRNTNSVVRLNGEIVPLRPR